MLYKLYNIHIAYTYTYNYIIHNTSSIVPLQFTCDFPQIKCIEVYNFHEKI